MHAIALAAQQLANGAINAPERLVVDMNGSGDLLRVQIDWSKVRDLASAASAKPVRRTHRRSSRPSGHAAWNLAAARTAISSLN